MVDRLIESFSYGGLLLVLLLGSRGLPIPEEVPIVAAGLLSHQEIMRWWIALPTCIAGVFAGDIILYWAGRHWGERVLEQPLVVPARLLPLRLNSGCAGDRRPRRSAPAWSCGAEVLRDRSSGFPASQ